MNIVQSIFGTTMEILPITIAVLTAILLGIAAAVTYIITNRKTNYSNSQALTLVMLPPVIAIIIILVVPIVGNNLATAFSIAGVFTIIRFRSLPAEPKDVAYVSLSLAIGLSCGLGYIYVGIFFAAIMIALLFILYACRFAVPKPETMMLKITVPEDLNFEDTFDDILKNYTSDYKLLKIRTCDFGALFEISYKIQLKKGVNRKQFIDELRVKNGNLNILLTVKEFDIQ
ncbi:MAG: DUF4956 domain-containing protein [Acutalibacteraceae bacterium]